MYCYLFYVLQLEIFYVYMCRPYVCMCTATYFDFYFLYCQILLFLQLEMHVRLICAIKLYLLT